MLSPYPIVLSIGTLIKPTLKQIFDPINGIGYEQYKGYEAFTKLTPKVFYTKLSGEEGLDVWESCTDSQRHKLEMFNVAKINKELLYDYLDLFNFFFEEYVYYKEGFFIWSKYELDFTEDDEVISESVTGVVNTADGFNQVISAIQQICCIYQKTDKIDNSELKFKNSKAKEIYEKIYGKQDDEQDDGEKEVNTNSKEYRDYCLPNIISAVSNNHPTISPINVWELTVFQLLDAFHRKCAADRQEMSSLHVSVWGDENNTYDSNIWLANEYDNN